MGQDLLKPGPGPRPVFFWWPKACRLVKDLSPGLAQAHSQKSWDLKVTKNTILFWKKGILLQLFMLKINEIQDLNSLFPEGEFIL